MSPTTAPMTFYDIALAPPVTKSAASPNPWKSRFALNFKNISYKTTWVPLLDISSVRGPLDIPASRKFADGSPYHTLPILSDPATGRIVGDSFEIATYLQEQYPCSGAGDLFPAQELEFVFVHDMGPYPPIAEAQVSDGPAVAYAKFNTNVDALFSANARVIAQGFPFDPAVAEECKAMFSKRVGVPWEAMAVGAEERIELFKAFEEALGELAKLYTTDVTGPFILGTRASYADFIVGGWLRMSRAMLPGEEWEALKGWHGGVFGRLDEALEVYSQMD
ncbi:Glutathione S-transferase/chloride channel, C-terminal [Penicillium expansum]|uniref:Glutathione S-transferase/chloride channel, C-terminal n=1 Tax=Penicillium expansum TaxID=27334 RepID=A0A0A2K875_PENEN|nr:Glutathione S-transferase/chloride channel, C-terminal [Penicillium expansum]KGO40588.1 Glutathione S-transferase/chloride channel, C-terminal [Penicillium expansum]KGO63061.1 Glutathione S-transferase/chloride channel, C-terminal [Penicillium expansum]